MAKVKHIALLKFKEGTTPEQIDQTFDQLLELSESIDGIEETHDRIRGVHGSHRAAIEAIGRLKSHGITVGCNTQINALSWKQLPQVMETIIAAGATHSKAYS